jgi:heme exporter protein CcmD
MSDYGFYLWGSYIVTFLFLFLEIVFLVKRKREAKA